MRLPSGSSARVPDILFVHTAHANRITETFLDGPADLVVEVVSLDSRDRDRSTKFFEYEQAGVSEYWLIDPLRQVAEFYRINAAGRYEHRSVDGDGYYRSLELNGFRLNPVWLWQDPLPEIQDVMRDTSEQ